MRLSARGAVALLAVLLALACIAAMAARRDDAALLEPYQREIERLQREVDYLKEVVRRVSEFHHGGIDVGQEDQEERR